MKHDRCEFCDGVVREQVVTVDLRRGSQLTVFEHVPVGVCTKCGERYYPGPLLESLDALAQHCVNGAKRRAVPVADYCKAG